MMRPPPTTCRVQLVYERTCHPCVRAPPVRGGNSTISTVHYYCALLVTTYFLAAAASGVGFRKGKVKCVCLRFFEMRLEKYWIVASQSFENQLL
jgi:hypothetical protein